VPPQSPDAINDNRLAREQQIINNNNTPPTTPHIKTKYTVGDLVYYKAHHLSNAYKKFCAGFAPKWLGPR